MNTDQPTALPPSLDGLRDLGDRMGYYNTNEHKLFIAHTAIAAVAAAFGVTEKQIMGRRRTDLIASARQTAMWICRTQGKMPYNEIGGLFADRDHGTAIHAVKAVEGRRLTSLKFRAVADAVADYVRAKVRERGQVEEPVDNK